MCFKVKTKHRNLQRSGGPAKREQYLLAETQVSIQKSEILNVSEVNFEDFLTPDPEPMLNSEQPCDVGSVPFQDEIKFIPFLPERKLTQRADYDQESVTVVLKLTYRYVDKVCFAFFSQAP